MARCYQVGAREEATLGASLVLLMCQEGGSSWCSLTSVVWYQGDYTWCFAVLTGLHTW